jgi:hypothetical protein
MYVFAFVLMWCVNGLALCEVCVHVSQNKTKKQKKKKKMYPYEYNVLLFVFRQSNWRHTCESRWEVQGVSRINWHRWQSHTTHCGLPHHGKSAFHTAEQPEILEWLADPAKQRRKPMTDSYFLEYHKHLCTFSMSQSLQFWGIQLRMTSGQPHHF